MRKGIILAVLGVVCIFAGVLVSKKKDFTELNTADKCVPRPTQCGSDMACCAVWDGSQCRKGELQGNSCVSKGNPVPAILIILGFVLLVVGFIMRKQ